jgi:hypothetical protein
MPIDLEAIRARLEEVKKCSCSGCVRGYGQMCTTEGEIVEDARTLLAEVERLRAILEVAKTAFSPSEWHYIEKSPETVNRYLASKHTGPELAAKIRRFNRTGEK